MADIENELHDYLKQHNVEPLLKELVVKLCIDKPDDELEYMRQYIVQLQKDRRRTAAPATDDDEEDEADQPPPVRKASRRGAVSASVMTADDVHNYEKKIVPKDAATMQSLLKTVRENVLFQHLDKDELTEVLDAMFLVKYKVGDSIIRQGDDGDNFYVVDQGTVEVWKAENGGADKYQMEISQNGSFGELALMYNQPRAASVKAKTEVSLWAIDQDTYRRILMGSTIRKRKLYETFLEQVDILKSVDKYERLQIADALESVSFVDGDVIVKQGDEGSEFFIIVEGNAVVTQTNEKGETGQVGELGPAQYFGEIALLKDNKRHATVSAKGTVKCVKVDRETFERVLGPCEAILRRNMDLYKKFTGSN